MSPDSVQSNDPIFNEEIGIQVSDSVYENHLKTREKFKDANNSILPSHQNMEKRNKYAPTNDSNELLIEAKTALQFHLDAEKCLKFCKQALKDSPNYLDAYSLQAQAHVQNGQLKEAIIVLEKALTIAPSDKTILSSLSTLLVENEQYDKAFPYLESLLKIEPENNKAKRLLKLCQRLVEDLQKSWITKCL